MRLLPSIIESSGAYATVGMAAAFAAASRAPITSTLILVEMTDDFDSEGAGADRHHGRDQRLAVAEPGNDLLGQGRTSRRRGRR